MEIKKLNPTQLDAYIRSETYEKGPVVPISLHRAQSHFKNPRLESDDVIMVLAELEGTLVGYLGVLADRIFLNGKAHKAGWLSCMWVDPNVRGKGIAKKLLRAVLDSWENRILVTEFTPAAKGLYDRSGAFMDLVKPVGLRGYLRPNLSYLLPRRIPWTRRIKPLLSLMDWGLSIPNAIRLKTRRYALGGVHWRYMPEVDPRHAGFVARFQNNNLERRGPEDLNWILKHPWILAGPEDDDISRRYHFSAIDHSFENFVIEVYSPENELIALLILTQRNRHLKVPYAFVEERAVGVALKLIYRHVIHHGVDMLSIWHPPLVNGILRGKHPFFLIRKLQRHYIISKVFEEDLAAQGRVTVQDGDADAAFT